MNKLKSYPIIIFFFLTLSIFLVSCQSAQTLPFDEVCDIENNGSTITTNGAFSIGASVYCSDISGKYRCGLNFNSFPDGDLSFSADVVEGKRKNQMMPLERGYTDDSLIITTASGALIGIDDHVTITGKMLVAENVCLMYVNKIEN